MNAWGKLCSQKVFVSPFTSSNFAGFEMGSTFQGCVEDMSRSFRTNDTIVRIAAIKCIAELAEGAGVSGRFVHSEILKLLKYAAAVWLFIICLTS